MSEVAAEALEDVAMDALGDAVPVQAAAILAQHVTDPGLAAAACDRFGVLASEGAAQQDALAAAGAVEIITAAMRAHPGDVGVQANGCGALGNLAQGHPVNRAAAAAAGAVELAAVAIRAHPESAGVQQNGARIVLDILVCDTASAIAI
jgi:hypothetical protein